MSTFSPPVIVGQLRKGALLYWHKTVLASVVLGLLICLPINAEIYRVVNEDGSVTFTDKKPDSPNANVTELNTSGIRNSVSTDSNTRTYDRIILKEQQAQQANQGKNRLRQARVAAAREALSDAKAALTAGQKIQAGDYIRTAGGGTRLSPAYQQRVSSLTKAVEQAEIDLSAAQRGQ